MRRRRGRANALRVAAILTARRLASHLEQPVYALTRQYVICCRAHELRQPHYVSE